MDMIWPHERWVHRTNKSNFARKSAKSILRVLAALRESTSWSYSLRYKVYNLCVAGNITTYECSTCR